MEHLRSRRPGPACRHFVCKLWQRSSSPQYARIVPSDDYDDLPDLIDTSPPPSPGSSASESPKRQRMAIDGRRFWSNSVNRDMLRVARGQSYAGNMICLAPGLHVSKFSLDHDATVERPAEHRGWQPTAVQHSLRAVEGRPRSNSRRCAARAAFAGRVCRGPSRSYTGLHRLLRL